MKTRPNDSASGYQINSTTYSYGLTKREYFAAMAMQGIVANPEAMEQVTKKHMSLEDAWNLIGKNSCKIADALIEQLNTKTSR